MSSKRRMPPVTPVTEKRQREKEKSANAVKDFYSTDLKKRKSDNTVKNKLVEKTAVYDKKFGSKNEEFLFICHPCLSLYEFGSRLTDVFFDVPCEILAKSLLGQVLVRSLPDGTFLKCKIVETECYLGGEDKASHSYNGRQTERNTPMFMKPGTSYVYFTYGMYHCFNISSQGPGAAVLIRAAEPIDGLEAMQLHRSVYKKGRSVKPLKSHELCNGPSKLCISLAIDRFNCNKKDLCQFDGMWIERGDVCIPSANIIVSHRIGIDRVDAEWSKKPLRFYVLGNTSVSKRDKVSEKFHCS